MEKRLSLLLAGRGSPPSRPTSREERIARDGSKGRGGERRGAEDSAEERRGEGGTGRDRTEGDGKERSGAEGIGECRGEQQQLLPIRSRLSAEPIIASEVEPTDSPVMRAVAQASCSSLTAIMGLTPSIWQREEQLDLLLLLIHHAMRACSDACVGHMVGHCLPLHKQLRPLMLYCRRVGREGLLPVICRHCVVDVERLQPDGRTILHSLVGAPASG